MKLIHLEKLKTSSYILGLSLLSSCGGTVELTSTPIGSIDSTPLKELKLDEQELKVWSHLDISTDTVPGVSLNKAYSELVKAKSKTIIVAVIDSGIDIEHEDLAGKIWINDDEIPGNGIDDDNNGYIDDVNGWNFLGDSDNERLEYVRLIASNDTKNPRFEEAKELLVSERGGLEQSKKRYEGIKNRLSISDGAVSKHLNKKKYTKEEVENIVTENEELLNHVSVIKQAFGFGFDSIEELMKQIDAGLKSFSERLDFNLNVNFDGRKVVGDNPNDINDKNYGDGNVMARKGRSHGTHVSGIIAANRNNLIGVKGAADNVKIMAVRNTPNGDEYDKDVALGVYYAVDNGARVINMSFGKGFSPHSKWVRDAIVYAAENDVLIVAAAGNDSANTDKVNYYPNDQLGIGEEVSNNFIKVGATGPKYGSSILAGYSNYGKSSVDVFAPGSEIYSTYPNQKYEYAQGTSMASPLVAGVAALILSQYPKLTASQAKQILMTSGVTINKKVTLQNGETVPFTSLSKSGKVINAYNALIMASKMSK